MKNQPSNFLREKLDQIETHLQTFIEGNTSQQMLESNFRKNLAHGLAESMRSHLTTWVDGRISAPYQYQIYINPSHGKTWIPEQYLLDELAEVIKHAGQDAGIYFTQSPDLRVVADFTLAVDEFRIEIPSTDQMTHETTYLSRTSHPKDPRKTKELRYPESYLIVNSNENFYLKQAVVNIGRSSSNHVIIDDPRVSRSHAQLRQIKGQYVLFDLNSKGGTFVNGSKVSQCTLNSGDVISLAGVPVIYVHDLPADANKTQTMKINSESSPNPVDPGTSSNSYQKP